MTDLPDSGRNNYRGRVSPVTTPSDAMRQFFAIVDQEGIPARVLAAENTLTGWRKGNHTPTLVTLEKALARIGYRIKLEKVK